MKRCYLLLLMFVLLANSCDDDKKVVVPPVNHNMNIGIKTVWSDDLLKFVTPILSYTDVDGLHEKIVEDTMMVDDIWNIGGETLDFYSQSWNYDFDYAYEDGDSVANLKLKYLAKEHAEIVDTETYTFRHSFIVSSIHMSYVDDEGKIAVYNYFGGQDSPNEVQCFGVEVRRIIDSLICHPFEREIIFYKGNVEIE